MTSTEAPAALQELWLAGVGVSGPPSPGRAGAAQQDAAGPGCHAAGAAQLEMQHIPAAAWPSLPDTSCPALPALRSACPLSLRAVPCPLHPGWTRWMQRAGGSSRTIARHPGDLWLSTGSDPAQRRWKCRITSTPDLSAAQLLPFLAFPSPGAPLQSLGA